MRGAVAITSLVAMPKRQARNERQNQRGSPPVEVERVAPNALGNIAGQTSALGTTRSTPE